MNEELISLISLETCGSICLLVIAFKIYTLKSDSFVQSSCCDGCLKIKSHFTNPGGRVPEHFSNMDSSERV